MKKLVLSVAFLGGFHAAQAQYFCTTQGTELHYINYDEAGQSVSNETVAVKNIEKEGNRIKADYYAKIVNGKAKNNTSYTLYNWSYDGTETVCTEDLMYGPYISSDSDPEKYSEQVRSKLMEEYKFKGNNSVVIKDNVKGGETISDYSYQVISGMLKNEITVSGGAYMGEERISTTAGKFDCMKISYLKRTKILFKTTTVRVIEWYAKGVGMVKSESYDMAGKSAGKTILVKINKG